MRELSGVSFEKHSPCMGAEITFRMLDTVLTLDVGARLLFIQSDMDAPMLLSPHEVVQLTAIFDGAQADCPIGIRAAVRNFIEHNKGQADIDITDTHITPLTCQNAHSHTQEEMPQIIQCAIFAIEQDKATTSKKQKKSIPLQVKNEINADDELYHWYSLPLLTPWQETILVRSYAYCDNTQIKNIVAKLLIQRNIRFITEIVGPSEWGISVPLRDRLQEAFIVFCTKLNDFDPSTGNRLWTYMYDWVKEHALRKIAPQDGPIKIPHQAIKSAALVHRHIDKITAQYGSLSENELVARVSQQTGLSPSVVLDKMETAQKQRWISIYQQTDYHDGKGDDMLVDKLPSYTENAEEKAFKLILRQTIMNVLVSGEISARQAQVLMLYCGLRHSYGSAQEPEDDKRKLNFRPGFTFEEIGEQIGLTREMVRLDARKAMEILSRNKEIQSLYRDFFEPK